MKRCGHRSIVATLVAVLLAFAALFAPTVAEAKHEPPPLRDHVVDAAGALDDAAERAMNARLEALRQQKGFAIVVYLPASLGDLTVDDVAYDTFNAWGVGGGERDDGVLLVVAPAEKKLRIETGKGVGDRITDVQSSRIIREVMTPRLKDGDVAGAVDEGTKAIERALTGEAPVPGKQERVSTAPRARRELTTTQVYVLGGVALLVLLLSIVSRTFRHIVFAVLRGLLWAMLLGRGGGGRGGGGGGGGGYGGDGGRSGGGGASGGW